MTRRGLTLLETLVALVILGLAGVAFMQVFGGAARTAQRVETWTGAVAHADHAIERAKLGERLPPLERLEGGFVRRIDTRPREDGLVEMTVEVALPDGGTLALVQLLEAR